MLQPDVLAQVLMVLASLDEQLQQPELRVSELALQPVFWLRLSWLPVSSLLPPF
jgi:hypothetical protein